MKRIIAVLSLFALLFSASCSGETGNTSSHGTGSTPPASSAETASFEKPEKVEHDGTAPTVIEGGSYIDVSNSITESQSSFSNFSCDTKWISDSCVAVFYIYNVQTMPNYFEPRLYVDVYNIQGEVRLEASKEFAGYAIGYEAYDNGFIAVFKDYIDIYDSSLNKLKSYSATEIVSYSADRNGNVVYSDAGKLKLNGNDIVTDITDVKKVGISYEGDIFAAGNDTKGAVFGGEGKKLAEAELTDLDKRYEIVAANGTAYFAGRPRGGVSLTAVKVTLAGEVTKLSYGEDFENTYAQGRIFEDFGTVYLVSSLTQTANDFGNLQIDILDGDLKSSATARLDGFYHVNHGISLKEDILLITENLSGDSVKSYMHVINMNAISAN